MPRMSGIDVCKIIRANPDYADLPIIFITASNEREHLLEDVWKVFWWSTAKTRVWTRLGKNRKKQS